MTNNEEFLEQLKSKIRRGEDLTKEELKRFVEIDILADSRPELKKLCREIILLLEEVTPTENRLRCLCTEDCIWCYFSTLKAVQMARKKLWNYARLILYELAYFEHPVRKRCNACCHIEDELCSKLEQIAAEQGIYKFDPIFADEKIVGSRSGRLV